MSYSLTLETAPARRTAAVLDAGFGGVIRCVEHPDGLPDSEWPRGVLHFFAEGSSTRGVEVIREDRALRVRLLSLAAPRDWELAYRFLTAFAGDSTQIVTGEDGTSATCADLAQRFAEVMARETAAGVAALEAALASQAGNQVRLPGAVRAVFIGPRLLSELPAGGSERVEALLERIRRLQFVELDGYAFTDPVPLRAPGIPSFAVWSLTRPQAFSPVECVGVSTEDGNLYIPVPALPGALGERFCWLDETQFAIAATSAAELPSLLVALRPLAIDPYRGVERKKRWWQFWRSE